jgi:hypothetical protein
MRHEAGTVYVIPHPSETPLRTCLCDAGPVGCDRECVGDSWYCAVCVDENGQGGACQW